MYTDRLLSVCVYLASAREALENAKHVTQELTEDEITWTEHKVVFAKLRFLLNSIRRLQKEIDAIGQSK